MARTIGGRQYFTNAHIIYNEIAHPQYFHWIITITYFYSLKTRLHY